MVFNLKKEWFDKIKSGKKKHEYRLDNNYWRKRLIPLKREVDRLNFYTEKIQKVYIYFACGYPKKNDENKRIKAIIKNMWVICGRNSDLKTDKYVWDIEFELCK